VFPVNLPYTFGIQNIMRKKPTKHTEAF